MCIVEARAVKKIFNKHGTISNALQGIDFEVKKGEKLFILGADAAGKTTMLRLIAGLLSPTSGNINVLGENPFTKQDFITANLSYMPQKFGLYEDLSIDDNIALYASMHGVPPFERDNQKKNLLNLVGLTGFEKYLAGRLSGGMKQKLALVCSLIKIPKLLILDEPTVGVDPLSRRELWNVVDKLVNDNGITVVASTVYIDEAEKADKVLIIQDGKSIAYGKPEDIAKFSQGYCYSTSSSNLSRKQLYIELANEGIFEDIVPKAKGIRVIKKTPPKSNKFTFNPAVPTLEDALVSILKSDFDQPQIKINQMIDNSNEVVIKVNNLTKRFGNFTAVHNSNFEVNKGDIFGLLGPNGAGKTTTFKMMCGFTPPSSGQIEIAGIDAVKNAPKARQNIGYMAQKFSLYSDLSPYENLDFFASVYAIKGKDKENRIRDIINEFDLKEFIKVKVSLLPGGYKQRLAMAVALIHNPPILFLDEPTSGVDPLARRIFWNRIISLSATGVTTIVTTHFMEEAEYCNKLIIQDAGKIIAYGTPEEIKAKAFIDEQVIDMQQAFINMIIKNKVKR